mmetsp:Transcript_106707/g.184053  ORF Transcript_106707/g.184053 Transcript_106707/m.184053 type:complete len:328 (+) Transcript_106707:652-1635(+)
MVTALSPGQQLTLIGGTKELEFCSLHRTMPKEVPMGKPLEGSFNERTRSLVQFALLMLGCVFHAYASLESRFKQTLMLAQSEACTVKNISPLTSTDWNPPSRFSTALILSSDFRCTLSILTLARTGAAAAALEAAGLALPASSSPALTILLTRSSLPPLRPKAMPPLLEVLLVVVVGFSSGMTMGVVLAVASSAIARRDAVSMLEIPPPLADRFSLENCLALALAAAVASFTRASLAAIAIFSSLESISKHVLTCSRDMLSRYPRLMTSSKANNNSNAFFVMSSSSSFGQYSGTKRPSNRNVSRSSTMLLLRLVIRTRNRVSIGWYT